MLRIFLITGIILILTGCHKPELDAKFRRNPMPSETIGYEKATFAGGCFWCMEPPFEKLDGVITVISGYSGGHKNNPTYEEVSAGGSGHLESIQIQYNPKMITYKELLGVFWMQIDPTDGGGSFVDRGTQYRSAIFYHDDEQKRFAEESREALNRSGRFNKPVLTEILPLQEFFPAEDYHQDYYINHSWKYKYYRNGSGRDQFLEKVWGNERSSTYKKTSRDELKKRLTPVQFDVTQDNGTEKAFHNEFWDNKKEGIYIDIVSGEPLFSSKDKFDSGTGWPSFSRPLAPNNIVNNNDFSLFMQRTEVRSVKADSHLGHVFNDGPPPTGMRYCINSAALRFIPKEDLEKEGYGKYIEIFE